MVANAGQSTLHCVRKSMFVIPSSLEIDTHISWKDKVTDTQLYTVKCTGVCQKSLR